MFHYITAQGPLAHCTCIYNSMNYESCSFHHSWIALPDVQITLEGTTKAQEEALESSDSQMECWKRKHHQTLFSQLTHLIVRSMSMGITAQLDHSVLCLFSGHKLQLVEPHTCLRTWPPGQRTYHQINVYSQPLSRHFSKPETWCSASQSSWISGSAASHLHAPNKPTSGD